MGKEVPERSVASGTETAGGLPAKCVRASALPLDGPARAGVLRAGPSPMGAGAAGVAEGASAWPRQQHAWPPSVARARPAGVGGRCPAVRLGIWHIVRGIYSHLASMEHGKFSLVFCLCSDGNYLGVL